MPSITAKSHIKKVAPRVNFKEETRSDVPEHLPHPFA